MSRPPPANGYRNMSNGSNPSMASQQRLATPNTHTRPHSPGSGPLLATANMSRAERFEDEKRRIMESCFSKVDANGQLSESYITHIRITEDAQYPSTPPPPESDEKNKKPRLIIIAVRSTGRVRMHKARENNNGSFSIGKTWNLEELSAIQTFSGPNETPRSEKEAQFKQWAGTTGFTVTITKPYYWQAGTSKEKDFFIASAVKIYRKYTKGQVPTLTGFGETERAAMLGAMPGQQAQQAQAQAAQAQQRQDVPSVLTPGMRAESREASPMDRPQPPFAQRPQSREGSRYRQSPGPPPSINDPAGPGSRPGSGPGSRQASDSRFAPPPPVGGAPRPYASQEHMRAPSREVKGDREGGYRPGTSPAPASGGNARSPLAPQQLGQAGLQAPRAPSTRSESPGGSSLASSVGPSRQQVRPLSPSRPQRPYEQSISSVSEDQRAETPQPGQQQQIEPERETAPPEQSQANGSGAKLFAATKQRWMGGQQQPPIQPPQQRVPSPTPPQLPQIETSQPFSSEQQISSAGVANPQTATSEASSAGINLDDAAAIGALTSYWGPEPTPAVKVEKPETPKQRNFPVTNEPSSPPTPERSAKRPQIRDRGASEASVDLRPPPLKQGARTPVTEEGSSYATPRDRSAQPTPRHELKQAEVIQPLKVEKRQSAEQRPASQKGQDDAMAKMPGAFVSTPLGGTPVQTPREEKEAPVMQQGQRQVEAEAEKEVPPAPAKEAEDVSTEAYRPGLGPMIKKSALRDKIQKAALASKAANAFKPRPGGAAEKILRAKAEREAGVSNGDVDGVSGFVPRPAPAAPAKEEVPEVNAKEAIPQSSGREDTTPKVEVFSPTTPINQSVDGQVPASMGTSPAQQQKVELRDEPSPTRLQTLNQQAEQEAAEQEAEKALFEQREARKRELKVKRRSTHLQRNLMFLGIDPTLLEGKGLDFEHTLDDFGWSDSALEPKKLVQLEADLRREQGRLEAGAWLSHTDMHRDDKVAQVEGLLDKAIAECDELEGLFTLYNVELGSLNEDIAFIEAQSQGLQVQSANQKGLKRELEGLVETMSLDGRTLEPLRRGELSDAGSLEVVEASLARLYKAMITIDPSIRANSGGRPKSRNGIAVDGTELSQMRALREKREVYEYEANQFVQRLMKQLDSSFTSSLNVARSKVMRPASGGAKRLNKDVFLEVRQPLWLYGPLILFTKELNQPAWQTLLRMYYTKAQPLYGDAFKENITGWRRAARRPGADEEALLFTNLEKEETPSGPGLNAARKLTIKRSQTLAKTLRNASGGNRSPTESRNPGQMMSSEVFAGSMDEMAPLISQEQNFVADLFRMSSFETADFLEAVAASPPDQRVGTNLLQGRPVDPDREMARRVTGVMDELFGFYTQEMTTMLEWSIGGDPLQGVGVMACLSKHAFYLQESNQEFLLQLLDTLQSKLQNLWSKFIEEQVRAIEDTKVKTKKRKGVIGFMKIFPHFAAAVENIFSAVGHADYDKVNADGSGPMFEVRRLVDDTYARLNKAMFDSLKVIAKESPTASTAPSQPKVGEDPEDKEVLNYHILMIENMNHYIEEVDDGGREGVLAEWRGKAMLDRAEATEQYVSRVVKRPLGKLMDFLESVESLLPGNPNPTTIASRPTFSRKAARNTFSQYDSKEVRKGIDTLRRRIEKHFGDADEEVISRNLVALMCKECERAYEHTIDRMERLVKEVYPPTEGEKPVEVDFSREDVKAGFRR